MLALVVSLAAVTYLDRVCIAITAPAIARDLSLTKFQMGLVFSAFTLGYALFEIPTGAWADRAGARKVLTRIVLWWSSFTMITGLASTYPTLLAVRFLFGTGEAGAWPTVAKAVSRWFPTTERGTAQGIFFMGAHLAGGLTPVLVTAMLTVMSWRMSFAVFGSIGFFWAVLWYWWFRDEPSQHRAVSAEERQMIELTRGQSGEHVRGTPWRKLATDRSVLALCGMYLTQSYGFYFYITWMPSYLENTRGFTSTRLAVFSGMPLLFSVVADLFGGITTDRLTRRYGNRVGRVGVGAASLALAAVFMVCGTACPNGVVAAFLISIAAAWSNFVLGAAWGAAVEVGGSHAGVVSACMNTSGQVGGTISPIIAALFLTKYASWDGALYMIGILYFLGALCWLFVNPSHRIKSA